MAGQTILWRGCKGGARVFCALERGCAGVELQIVEEDVVSRRERYPDRSSAYERSRGIRAEFDARGYETAAGSVTPSLTTGQRSV
jgi:hypothetical protein